MPPLEDLSRVARELPARHSFSEDWTASRENLNEIVNHVTICKKLSPMSELESFTRVKHV